MNDDANKKISAKFNLILNLIKHFVWFLDKKFRLFSYENEFIISAKQKQQQ